MLLGLRLSCQFATSIRLQHSKVELTDSQVEYLLLCLEGSVFDEVDVRFPDVAVVVDAVKVEVAAAVIVAQAGILPPLVHQELNLVVLDKFHLVQVFFIIFK